MREYITNILPIIYYNLTIQCCILESLDSIERGLYYIGQTSRKRGDSWLFRTTGKISTSSIVQKHRKLKRKADVLND